MVSFRSLGILLVLAGSSAFAQAQEKGAALAARFVRATAAHEQAAMGLRMLGDKLMMQGEINEAQLACFKQTRGDDYLTVMQQIATSQLSAAEMQEAIGFFESRAGKKYLQMSEAKVAEKIGVKSEVAMPDLSAQETAAVYEFAATGLFQKLVNQRVMTKSDVARPLLNAKSKEIIQRCAPGWTPQNK